MTSFFDLFKWDRFVATSVIELLFWLLAAIAVLFGISGLLNGLALVQLAPVSALLAIAFSIIGTLAAVVAARVVCEAVIMLFRLNENLMDIRDQLASQPERASSVAAAAPVAPDPFVVAFEEMLPAPPTRAASPAAAPAESRGHETQAPAPRPPDARPESRSSETSSLEARLAEIRARRESVAAAAARASATTPGPAVTDAGLAGARLHLEEAAGPKAPAAEAQREESKSVNATVPKSGVPIVEAVEAAAAKIPEHKVFAPKVADAPRVPEAPKAPEVKVPENRASEVEASGIASHPVKAPLALAPDIRHPVAGASGNGVPEVHPATAPHRENHVPEVKAPAAKATAPEAMKPDTQKFAAFSEAAVVKAIEAALVEQVVQVPRDEVTDAADRLVDEAIKSLSAGTPDSEAEDTAVASGPDAGKRKTSGAA